MNPKQIGEISEAIVVAKLMKAGRTVLRPLGDNQRYDMVIEREDGGFDRVQCKTGRITDGAVRFPSSSSAAHRGDGRRSYHGDVEYIAVYCPDNDQSYLVPIEDCAAITTQLRLSPPKNNQRVGVKYASEFLI